MEVLSQKMEVKLKVHAVCVCKSVCELCVDLYNNYQSVLCICLTAPEVVNYEPLGLEADMW